MAISIESFHRQVQRSAMRLRVKPGFGFGHRFELWDNPVFVVIQANAQIYFVVTGVVFKTLHQ
ncbi:hypothetical protein NGUA15_00277 [Salmonella enterica]|nr:hypothetical protein NGUA15_00277 [Salmonella enterica]